MSTADSIFAGEPTATATTPAAAADPTAHRSDVIGVRCIVARLVDAIATACCGGGGRGVELVRFV
jgi:hypothetical protein